MAVRITCIKKDNGNHDNPHVAISTFGWLNESTGENGETDRETMYDWLENKGGEAYVKSPQGDMARVHRRISAYGTRFLQTALDNTWQDNLLSLMECRH